MTKTKLAAAALLLIGSAASASAIELYYVSLYQAPVAGTYYANQVAPRADNVRDSFARAERAPVAKSPLATIVW